MTLHEAVAKGKTGQVRRLLKGGFLSRPKADVNVNEKCDGLTPLHKAARYGHSKIVKLLLDHGADVNAKTDYGFSSINGRTPLHESIAFGTFNMRKREICALLLKHGADVNAQDQNKETPLLESICPTRVNTGICALLVEHGADVNSKDCYDRTPLFRAATLGMNAKAFHHKPVFCGMIETCVLLLQNDADPNDSFHSFAGSGSADICELLLKHGADVNAKGFQDRTPLHRTAEARPGESWYKSGCGDVHLKITVETLKQTISVLLRYGADINAKDKFGMTPLHLVKNGDIADQLLAQGADINAKDKDDRTPLHSAATRGLTQTVSVLLEHGADIHVKDKQGATPLDEVSAKIKSELDYDYDSILGLGSWMKIRDLLATKQREI